MDHHALHSITSRDTTGTDVEAISITQRWFYLSVEKDTRKDIEARSEYLPAMWATRQYSGSYNSKDSRWKR